MYAAEDDEIGMDSAGYSRQDLVGVTAAGRAAFGTGVGMGSGRLTRLPRDDVLGSCQECHGGLGRARI